MLADLNAEFAAKFVGALNDCLEIGVTLKPILGFVNVVRHAELWKQGKRDSDIDIAIQDLRKKGCPFLMSVLMNAGSTVSVHKTQTLPGLCWHNFGKALDIELMDSTTNKPVSHSDSRLDRVALIYLDNELFFEPAHCSFANYHLQDQSVGSPLGLYSPEEIDKVIFRSYRDGNHNN